MSTLAEALAPKSDQLNADDLIPGPRVLKITGAKIGKDGRQLRISLSFEGDQGKPWKPCKTMGRAMVMAWAITEESQFVGKSVRVYRDPDVQFGDQGAVGGIRISHMSHIAKPANIKLTVSQGQKRLFTFHPLVTAEAPAKQSNPDQERADAIRWVEKYEADCRNALDQAALDAVHAKAGRALPRLATKFPDLHERAMLLVPAEPEGRPDADFGESHTDADAAAVDQAEHGGRE